MDSTAHDRHETPPLIFLTNRIGRLLANAIRDSMREEDAQVLPQHMGVLSDLWVRDGLRQQDLAISLIKDKATIARSLRTLEEQNIVVRVADPDDKRNKRIYLTHKGKSLKSALLPRAKQVQCEAMASIRGEDVQTCLNVLEQIYENLKKLRPQPK